MSKDTTDHQQLCGLVVSHEGKIATVEAKTSSLENMASEMFRRLRTMEDTALSSSKDIEAVREKVENGLLDPVLKKIEELCQSNNTAHIVLTGKVDDAVKEATNLGKRVDKLERVNWFPKWVDSTSKKILCGLVILLFYMAVNSLSNAVTWGLAKAMIFGERPGVMKIIFEEVKKPIEPGQKEVPK